VYLHANAKLGVAGRLALVRAIEEGLSLKAAADARVPARSLESAAPLAAPACVRARGGDLRLPLPDRLGAEVDRRPDRVRALDGLEGAPPSRHLATGGGRQGAGQPGRPQLD
jgi:hypothetical protein